MPPLTELKATQALLQKAHDYIEINGFRIDVYSEKADQGPCCYIGTVRRAAGLDACPPRAQADEGDGPELTRAFKILDSIAKRKLSDVGVAEVKEGRDDTTGRFVERLGFELQDRIYAAADEEDDSQQEADEALRIFRRALTKVHKQIEAKS